MWAALVAIGIASAAVPAPVLLSRFPAGAVPPTEAVFQAIAELADDPAPDALPLLRSLARHEQGEVAEAARTALDTALTHQEWQDQAAARADFRDTLPSGRELSRWLGEQRRQAPKAELHQLGRAEQGAVAYAALVAGTDHDSAAAEPVPDDQACARLLEQGLHLEAEDRMHDAVQAYARAAAGGRAEAFAALDRLGVDADRLLLGMTTSARVDGLLRLSPEQVRPTLREAHNDALAVLIERARERQGLDRLVALDNLGRLVQSDRLSPVQRRTVRGVLEQAAHDPKTEVRQLAQASLAGPVPTLP